MKKLLIIIAAVAALLPMGSCKKAADESIRVISSNVRLIKGQDGENSWEYRKGAFPVMLQEMNPTVFGVQEAYAEQLAWINETAPQYACVGVGREDGISEGEHMSIFYKKDEIELLDWGTYWLSETPDVPSMGWDAACYRTATWTKLKVIATGKEFFYVNTHLDHRGVEARKLGLALIVNRIGEMNPGGKLPMILTGDFNVYPDDKGLVDLDKIMKSARIYAEDTDTKGSFNGWGRANEIIDYIYYSGFKKCTNFKVVDQSFANVPYISDHYPVVADIIF